MAVFAIMGISGLPVLGAKIAEMYPDDHYDLTAGTWLVSDAGPARAIADKLTLTDGALGSTALVTPMGTYYGWGPKGAWDWISTKVSAH